MKTERAGGYRPLSHEQVLREVAPDSYRQPRKPPDPVVCPRCGAAQVAGRWSWRTVPSDAFRHECPACRRIEDKYPAGYLTLRGPFAKGSREELLAIIHSREAAARAEHPLQRVMAIEDRGDALLVTTTDPHLARRIARAVQRARKGDLEFHYSDSDNLLRVTWAGK